MSISSLGAAGVLGIFFTFRAEAEQLRKHETLVLLDSLSMSFKAYDTEYNYWFDQYPFVSNSQILQALTGDNPRKIHFAEFPQRNIDPKGLQITDSWGTPIHFAVRPGALPSIRSLGHDRTLGTSDDLVANE